MNSILLCLDHIGYSYHTLSGETKALHDISFHVYENEFIAIVGPSGCGKSTLLSIISGLIRQEHGELHFAHDSSNIGYMLQQDHLLPWRSIYENVLLGPEIQHRLTPGKKSLALKLLADYGLLAFKDKRPTELSGGMRQRAALIRTMVMEPEVLLLDEPFSALDYQTRLTVSADIGRIIRKMGITTILITHDLSEAISLADRVIVLSKRPGTVKKELPIQLTLPDDSLLAARNAPEFHDYFSILWEEIADEKTNETSGKT